MSTASCGRFASETEGWRASAYLPSCFIARCCLLTTTSTAPAKDELAKEELG